jgi:FlaA1/EpsC-like NDP-sugar epimerase
VVGIDPAPGEHTQVLGSVADRPLVDRIFAKRRIEAVIHAGALHKPDITRYPRAGVRRGERHGTLNCSRRRRRRGTTASSSLPPLP